MNQEVFLNPKKGMGDSCDSGGSPIAGLFHGKSHLEMDDLGVAPFQESSICISKSIGKT